MITKKWQLYPTYKDSGVEWLGAIPEHWKVKKCKQLSLIKRGASPRPIDNPSFFDDDGAYSWVRISDVTASNKYLETSEQKLSELGKSKSIALEPGELFVSICATVGKPIITNIKCCIHDGFVYFPFLKENREYLFYIFSGGELYKGLGKQGTQLNLNTEIIGDIKLPIPPLPEQQKIAEFLDQETSKIDKLITKKERLIELLKEKRTALISHAVTKGLNPDVPMKDSGVEWLGEIPEHWENWKISHAFQKIGSGTTPSTNRYDYYDGDVPWINTSELRENIITDTSVKITNKALLDNSVLNLYSPGTLLIAMYGATIGRLGILGITACTNQACCALANPILLDTKFVFYWLWMRRNELIILSSGGGQPNINQEKIRSIKIPAPPLPEQQKIAEFLDRETSKIDNLITKTRTSIDHLKEYRTALISAAVTGKIDVREH
ncbi:restriction endonuclease subunit S [Microcystis aeruginosa]|uniref:restriction endonuclease subunit S n=1 Tax=Microcystis aeruginosa TaxID=1126 RepID=UPI001D1596C9|nr:restriction endonuclease subunit S [Microcystis aeruginosa]